MTFDQAVSQTKSIAGQPDLASRNRSISRAYAQLYLAREQLRWAGMAAFVSNHVGCAIRSSFPGICTRGFLANGNRLVFEDIYPALLLYDALIDVNPSALSSILQVNDRRIEPAIAKALTLLIPAHFASPVLEREAAEILLEHEQSSVLQVRIFDSVWVGWLMRGAALASRLKPSLLAVKFTSSCSQPNRNFVIFPPRGVNLAIYSERWPFAKQVAERFHQLVENATNAQIVRQHCSNI